MIDRLSQLIKFLGISVRAFEQSISASDGMIRRAISNQSDIQSKWLSLIADNYPNVSMDWLIAGKGSMLKDENSSVIQQKDNTVSIPIVEIGAAAGIQGYDNPTYMELVDSIDLPTTMVRRNSKYFCIRVRGESMAPTLLDSGYLVVRLLERGEWQDIINNHIYVISTTQGTAYVKRVKNRLPERGFIVCMSDNPDKVSYSNFNLYQEELHSILYAEWYFTAKMPNIHETYYHKLEDLDDKYDMLNEKMNVLMKHFKQVQ